MTPPSTPLSPRQAQVARLLQRKTPDGKPYSYALIGDVLGIGYSAVVTHVNAAAKKWPDERLPRQKLMEWREG